MKKIIVSCAVVLFGLTSAHAATMGTGIGAPAVQPAVIMPGCSVPDVEQFLKAGETEKVILNRLILPDGCNMTLSEAVDAIVAGGGDLINALAAALIQDPDFAYFQTNDPTAGLDATAAGPGDTGFSGTSNRLSTAAAGGGGGGLVVSP